MYINGYKIRHVCTVTRVNMNGKLRLPFNLSADRLKGKDTFPAMISLLVNPVSNVMIVKEKYFKILFCPL